MSCSDESRDDIRLLTDEIGRLKEEDKELRDSIQEITNLLQQEGEDSRHLMYVTQGDVRSMPCYEVSQSGQSVSQSSVIFFPRALTLDGSAGFIVSE